MHPIFHSGAAGANLRPGSPHPGRDQTIISLVLLSVSSG